MRPEFCDPDGYGRISYRGRDELAHRVVVMLARGLDALDGCDVHHLCGQRSCVELTHLVPMTREEHRALVRTACRSCGTPYPPDAPSDARGCRRCAACHGTREARRRARRAARGVAVPLAHALEPSLEPVELVTYFRERVSECFPGAYFAPSKLARDLTIIRDQWLADLPAAVVREILGAAVEGWGDLARVLGEQDLVRTRDRMPQVPRHPTLSFLTRHLEPVVEWYHEHRDRAQEAAAASARHEARMRDLMARIGDL